MLSDLRLHRLLPRAAAARLLLGPYWDHAEEREVDWLVGAAMLVRRDVVVATGGFDERLFLYGEEVEWCRRIRAAASRCSSRPMPRSATWATGARTGSSARAGRVDRCLLAEDRLLARWNGRAAGAAAGGIRVLGACLRLAGFGLRAALGRDDAYGRATRDEARLILDHYRRRLARRLPAEVTA